MIDWGYILMGLQLALFSEFDASDDKEYSELVNGDSDTMDENMGQFRGILDSGNNIN
jgi:hypothetical protein